MSNKTLTLGNGTYEVINVQRFSYVGHDDNHWEGPCILCGSTSFSIIVATKERKYQHFCSGRCAMCFDDSKQQNNRVKLDCENYIKNGWHAPE